MDELKFEELLEKAKNNDEVALRELRNYYEEVGEEDNMLFYQEKIDNLDKGNVDSFLPAKEELQSCTAMYQENDFDYWDEYQAFINGEYNELPFSTLKENKENNPYFYEVLAKRYYDGKQFADSVEYYEKEIKILEKSKKLNSVSLFLSLYGIIEVLYCLIKTNDKNYCEKYFNYINNALEIDVEDFEVVSKKPKLYFFIMNCYNNGIGCEQNQEKANEYDEKGSSFTIRGCLKQSVKSHNNNKVVDEAEWMEKAIEASKNTEFKNFKGNNEEYQKLLELKLILRIDDENDIKINDYPDLTIENEDCFTDVEKEKIKNLLIYKSAVSCLSNSLINLKKENYDMALYYCNKARKAPDFLDKIEYKIIADFLLDIINKEDANKIVEKALFLYYSPEYNFDILFKFYVYKIIYDALKEKIELNSENKDELLSFCIERCENNSDEKNFFYDVITSDYFEVENFKIIDEDKIEFILDLIYQYDKEKFWNLIEQMREEIPVVLEFAKKYENEQTVETNIIETPQDISENDEVIIEDNHETNIETNDETSIEKNNEKNVEKNSGKLTQKISNIKTILKIENQKDYEESVSEVFETTGNVVIAIVMGIILIPFLIAIAIYFIKLFIDSGFFRFIVISIIVFIIYLEVIARLNMKKKRK